jgi:hypothetical protein
MRLTGWLLAVSIGWIPLAPPEHIHERDAGHQHLIVHRHAQVHGASHHVAVLGGVVDDDDPILTLDWTGAPPVAPPLASAPDSEGVRLLLPPASQVLHRTSERIELLIHGPPCAPASFRAPPSSHV